MTKPRTQPRDVPIALLGELSGDERRYLDACVAALGGKIVLQDSPSALRNFVFEHRGGPAVIVLTFQQYVTGVVEVVMYLRRIGAQLPVILLAGKASPAYLPLWQELGVRPVQGELRGTQFSEVLRAALTNFQPTTFEPPPLTNEEQGANIGRLADDLNRRIRCGAGKSQVFLHSFVEGIGQKTTPRITLRCPLRTELSLENYVYYEHIRDVCCGAAESCAALRAYAAWKGQQVSAYLPENAVQEKTMSEPKQVPQAPAQTAAGASAARPQSIEHARPRRGLLEKDQFLLAVARLGASDLHLKTGAKPRVRVGGVLRTLDLDILPTEEFEQKLFEFLSAEQQQRLMEDGSVDLAYDVPGSDRFRINVFRQESGLSVAARRVTRKIPSLEDLHLPAIIEKIAENEQGLVLLAGVTGSGKSTTIAAMIEHINQTCANHIVTIEDPIEYLFTPKKALINQREIGINVKDFPTALRALVREDPDVVLIGELRDAETFRAALQAAETGHLVFGTVHASNCAQTIGRVLDLFPEGERHAVRQSFVFNLRAIIAQKLLRSVKPGVSRVPANEVLINTPIVQKLIAEQRDTELLDIIRGGDDGMRSFTNSLQWLMENDFIDGETAFTAAPNPDELRMHLKGIRPAVAHVAG